MVGEIDEIREFLAGHYPFDQLPADVLSDMVREVEISFVPKGTAIILPDKMVEHLSVIRTGAVETRDPQGQLMARIGEGGWCGSFALLRGAPAVFRSETIEDCLLYLIPARRFQALLHEHPAFHEPFAVYANRRLRASLEGPQGDESLNSLSRRIEDLLTRGASIIAPEATILEAARRMRDEKVSYMLIQEKGELKGIVTDKDLRTRVIAENMDHGRPIGEVMSPGARCVDVSDFALDALLEMSSHNIHHLPVKDGGEIVGCLTHLDLLNAHVASPVSVVRDIHRRDGPEGLRKVISRAPKMVQTLVDTGVTAQSIGRIMSTVADAATVRLIELAEARIGPPPVPYVWLAAGSQARNEQTALSDQDNCMIIDDAYDETAHGDYFKSLAETVCDGLNTCGYVFCPGDAMARNPHWRRPLAVWKGYFDKWIEQPEPKALMLSSIFFDLRPVHGEAALFEELNERVLAKSKQNRIFLAHMAGNALTHDPPLGFFRNFVLVRGGEHDHTVDLKHRGIVPIVDLARLYALSEGVAEVNTYERLSMACETGAISNDGAMDMRDALDFIAVTRLRHQAAMVRDGRKADNFVAPDDLSSIERAHLKNAFTVVKDMQSLIATIFHLNRF